jgi:type I restriction enzyme R subunit
MNKQQLSEQEIRTRYITPAIQTAGWTPQQIREEVTFTAGRIIVRGKLSTRSQERKRVDYLLYFKPNLPLALIEAKDNNHSVGARHAAGARLRRHAGRALRVLVQRRRLPAARPHRPGTPPSSATYRSTSSPAPEELWRGTASMARASPRCHRGRRAGLLLGRPGKEPRYYQANAINRVTVEAVAKGQRRILLVMATGTGKTYTAFQIIWRLWKAA